MPSATGDGKGREDASGRNDNAVVLAVTSVSFP
jgi:hypothetical protein